MKNYKIIEKMLEVADEKDHAAIINAAFDSEIISRNAVVDLSWQFNLITEDNYVSA
jgi:hypothetical protein